MKRALLAAVLVAAIAVGVAGATTPSLLYPSTIHKTAPATFKVKFVTTKGPFVITVTRSWAPIGADRFYSLVYYHYYDNEPIFRVLPAYIAQWGINMHPPIAKAWRYATIRDENPPSTHKNLRGTVAFTVAGAHTRATQIFVNLRDNLSFGPKFAPIGKITSGMNLWHLLYHGYGEGPQSNQAGMIRYGAWWVKKYYPKLDWIKTARIVP
jgi:peptidyl-prolyl cis-trans isomerase A (cyclophilin A)